MRRGVPLGTQGWICELLTSGSGCLDWMGRLKMGFLEPMEYRDGACGVGLRQRPVELEGSLKRTGLYSSLPPAWSSIGGVYQSAGKSQPAGLYPRYVNGCLSSEGLDRSSVGTAELRWLVSKGGERSAG